MPHPLDYSSGGMCQAAVKCINTDEDTDHTDIDNDNDNYEIANGDEICDIHSDSDSDHERGNDSETSSDTEDDILQDIDDDDDSDDGDGTWSNLYLCNTYNLPPFYGTSTTVRDTEKDEGHEEEEEEEDIDEPDLTDAIYKDYIEWQVHLVTSASLPRVFQRDWVIQTFHEKELARLAMCNLIQRKNREHLDWIVYASPKLTLMD